ncbi:MAG: transcription-repair coupling factor [Clostridia bacterium]|nr:transcription-repair coupling factor [Clostridia bacterium]
MDFLSLLNREPALQELPFEGRYPLAINGLQGQSSLLTAAYLCKQFHHKGIYVTRQEAGGKEILAAFRALLGEKVYYLPERDFLFDSYSARSKDRENEQAEVLKKLRQGDYAMIVAPLSALLMPIAPPEVAEEQGLLLKVGVTYELEELTAYLVENGYTAFELVEGSGSFARRGGILDIFSPNYPDPLRVEFFGDEIDRIVFFDVLTQRTLETAEEAEIVPCHSRKGEERRLIPLLQTIDHPGAKADLERLKTGRSIAADRYLPLLYPELFTPLELHDDLLFIEEYGNQQKVFSFMEWQLKEEMERLAEKGEYMADGAYFLSKEAFEKRWNGKTLLLSAIAPGVTDCPMGALRQLRVLEDHIPFYQEDTLLAELERAVEEDYAVVLTAGDRRAAELKAALTARHIPLSDAPKNGFVCCTESTLSFNLRFPDAKFLLLCDGNRKAEQLARRKGTPKGEKIRSFNDITPGDLVVHVSHGIGVYKGIRQVENQGVTKDYIVIGYDKGDTLFVPCPQLDLISKYIGTAEDHTVKLSRLGGTQWEKTKAKVKNQSREVARELIALYAKRLKAPGIPFDPDTDWQLRFEERFPYAETDDQIRCVEEIKKDMEQPNPMDRLLCGDVGFGKTEVALRAAFKAVDNGFQVAILCPTTILSEQHYQTVKERFSDFPITSAVLNRFRTAKETKQILSDLETGRVDILIGTHRILSGDIHFKKLGLLIIDEEQRFGVKHKEKIKELSVGVDVLTMSATPIPRTLNMALSGIRDLSIIEDPPADRQPVTTYVLEYDQDLILSAIARELKRGGCVFYMKNDVEALDHIAERLSAKLPEARIAIGHGKMSGVELEKTWERVLKHEVDILVCTTIIETGIDVSFANTLIIEDADRLGLSQLHQIRGRVGRSSTRAYAYLTYRQGSIMNEVAAKRLATIREFTEFGSGLKIAMRDLEIRGVGALLGEKQHGQMNIVGYDMYMRILKEAVEEEQGITEQPKADCAIDISVSAFIPKDYVPSEKTRIDLYKKIAALSTQEDYEDMVDELCDRFSDPPESILNLMKIALLRALARSNGIMDIKQKQDSVLFFVSEPQPELLSKLVHAMKGRVLYSIGAKPYFTLRIQNRENLLEEMNHFLQTYSQLSKESPPQK